MSGDNRFQRLARPGVADLKVYEPGLPLEEVARSLGLEDALSIDKLASNENPLGPSPLAVKAVREEAASMHRYPDGGGFYLARDVADWLELTPDHLVFTNGSNEAIELIAHAFLAPGSSMVASAYAFVVYRLVAAMMGATFIEAPSREYGHDPAAMLAAIRDDTRLVFVANPNNPTGTMWEEARLLRFLDDVPDHVIPVVDEAYVDLLPDSSRPDLLREIRGGRAILVLRTFSKAFGLAGLRIGYAIGPPEGIALLQRVRQPFNVNVLAQAAARAAIQDVDFLRHTRETVCEERAYLSEAIAGMGLAYVPSSANFVLIRTGEGRAVFQRLQEHKVIVRPMDGYGLPEFIRVTVGIRAENDRFLAALADCLAGVQS